MDLASDYLRFNSDWPSLALLLDLLPWSLGRVTVLTLILSILQIGIQILLMELNLRDWTTRRYYTRKKLKN